MAKKQDAYECYNCKTRHSTDNMAAYCAVCYYAVEASCQMFQSQAKKAGDRVDEIEAENKRLRGSLAAAQERIKSDEREIVKKDILAEADKALAALAPRDEKPAGEGPGVIEVESIYRRAPSKEG